MAPQARQMAADGHGRSLDCSVAQGVSARCNEVTTRCEHRFVYARVKVSESAKTSLYMYFELEKPVVNSEFNEGGSPKL